MKKLILLFSFFITVSLSGQFTKSFKKIRVDTISGRSDTIWISNEIGSTGYLRVGNDSLYFGDVSGEYSLKSLAISSGSVSSLIIGHASINNGDSILLVINCDSISYIDFILNTGTDYDGSGADVTTLYIYLNGVKTQFAYIPESWILSSTEIRQRVFFTASHDLGSPIWIEFGAQFYNGTRDLHINYKKE